MYISEKTLRLIFLSLIGIAIILCIATTYFYSPSLINKFGLNRTPSPGVAQMLKDYNSPQSAEQYIELDKQAIKLAQSTPNLDISNCTPYPRVIKTNTTNLLKVTNSDEGNHTLYIYGKSFIVRGNSWTIIQFQFVNSNDVIPYSCDDLNSFTGIISISKEI